MKSSKLYCVYTLRVHGERFPFYIGKSYVGSSRIEDHITSAKNDTSPKAKRMRKAWADNKKIIHEVVLLTEDEEEAFKMEAFLVLFYGRRDNKTGRLTNQTNGGKGTTGLVRPKKKKKIKK